MSEISNIKLKFACDADWDSMEYVDGVKHCDHCQKKVYDFTDAKPNEFFKILAENNNNLCGRFRADQMAPKHPILPAWKKWVSAALVLIGINILGEKAEAQTKTKATEVNTPKADSSAVFGIFESEPRFPGGMRAYESFIKNNLHFTKDMISGKVIVNFIVNKDGTLSDFKVLRSPGELNSAEAIRVLKLSPKWAPDLQKGEPQTSSYSVAVIFQK